MEAPCAENAAEQARVTKLINEEEQAIRDTIKILTTDEVFQSSGSAFGANKKKATSFLQLRGTRLERAVAALQKTNNGQAKAIALMATKAGAFDKVIAAIDDLGAELKKKKEDNVALQKECVDNMRNNETNDKETETQLQTLEHNINAKEQGLAAAEEDLKVLRENIKNVKVSMAQLSEDRLKANTEYIAFVGDNEVTSRALAKAISRMQETYAALLQQPAGLKAGEYKATRGGGVLDMLQDIKRKAEDSNKAALAEEKKAQAEYATSFNDLVTELRENMDSDDRQTAELAQLRADHSALTADHKSTTQERMALLEEKKALALQCNFHLAQFDNIQAAISKELEGLAEAKAILLGAGSE